MNTRTVLPVFCAILSLFAIRRVTCCARTSRRKVAPRPVLLSNSQLSLFDFTSAPPNYLEPWTESSDTARDVGMSKASFVMQTTQKFQRAVFFGLLNPQPNGACFAGFKVILDHVNLSGFKAILLRARGQGEAKRFKVVLRHKGENSDPQPGYEQVFDAPQGSLQEVRLEIKDFAAYVRGRRVPDAPPLDTKDITSFGLQVFGGVYEADKQRGAATLELDWIRATA